jgi:hypothetical protein
MTPPENDVLQAVAIVLFAICLAYAAGRMHQWYLHALERDQAWRHGYDLAARSLFHLATRVTRPQPTTRRPDAPRGTLRLAEDGGGRHALAPAGGADDATVAGLVQQRTRETLAG